MRTRNKTKFAVRVILKYTDFVFCNREVRRNYFIEKDNFHCIFVSSFRDSCYQGQHWQIFILNVFSDSHSGSERNLFYLPCLYIPSCLMKI